AVATPAPSVLGLPARIPTAHAVSGANPAAHGAKGGADARPCNAPALVAVARAYVLDSAVRAPAAACRSEAARRAVRNARRRSQGQTDLRRRPTSGPKRNRSRSRGDGGGFRQARPAHRQDHGG